MAGRDGVRAKLSYVFSTLILRKVFLPVVVACFLPGCAGVFYSPLGKVVPEQYRILLVGGGAQSGVWQTGDLSLDYQYRRNENTLEISGAVRFTDRIRYNFSIVNRFRMDVVFSDDQGRAIGVQPLMSAFGYSQSKDEQPFARRLILPQGTAFMAFSYDGEAINIEPDETTLHFWHYAVF